MEKMFSELSAGVRKYKTRGITVANPFPWKAEIAIFRSEFLLQTM